MEARYGKIEQMGNNPHLIYSPEVLSSKFTIEYIDLDLTPSGGLPLVGYLLDKS